MTSEERLREMADSSSRYRQPTDATDKIACRHGAEALALLRELVESEETLWPRPMRTKACELLAEADHAGA